MYIHTYIIVQNVLCHLFVQYVHTYVICTVQRYWIDSCTLNTSSCTLLCSVKSSPCVPIHWPSTPKWPSAWTSLACADEKGVEASPHTHTRTHTHTHIQIHIIQCMYIHTCIPTCCPPCVVMQPVVQNGPAPALTWSPLSSCRVRY